MRVPAIDALNLTPRPDAKGVDRNPCTRPDVLLMADKLALAPINDLELSIFKAQFGDLMSMDGSDERRIMLARVEQYILGLRAVKQALNQAAFSGVNAGDTEVGMQIIRPQFTRAAATWKTDWTVTVAAAWADWLYEVAGQPFAVGKDFGLCVTHLKGLVTPSPLTAEVKFQISRTGILLPQDVRALAVGDTTNQVSIVPLPTMILIPKASFYARIRSDVGGKDNLALGGVVFGLGRVLKEEVPTWTA